MHVYEVRPRKDRRSVNLISDALPFGRLCHEQASTQSSGQSSIVGHIAVMLTRSKKCGVTKRATAQRRKCLAQRH